MTAMREILVYPMPNGKYVIIASGKARLAKKTARSRLVFVKIVYSVRFCEEIWGLFG